MKRRIWELDAVRGLCILGMVAVHLVYDLVELYGLVDWRYPSVFMLVKDWGGELFLLLSGICVTLGSHPVKRGLLVFCCGLVVTGVTVTMAAVGLAGWEIVIYFGVLHCLGCCMLLWPLAGRLPDWALGALGAGLVALGLWFRTQTADGWWLIPLGLTPLGFASSDYFPMAPHLGFFLLGAVVGRQVYWDRQTRFPRVNTQVAPIRYVCGCGRSSLWIYLLHQPVLTGICAVWTLAA